MLDEKTVEWVNSCETLEKFSVVVPPGTIIDCLVYVDKYGRTISEDGIGPVIHSVLNVDTSDNKIALTRDLTLHKYYEGVI